MSDPYAAYVELLFNFNGSDGSTAIVEEAKGRTVTVLQQAQLDTAQKRFGVSSLLLDGSGDRLTLADHADFALGTDDFCLETFIRFNSIPSGTQTKAIAGHLSTTPNSRAWSWVMYGNSDDPQMQFAYSTNGTSYAATMAEAWTPSANTWYHIAVARDGSTLRMFVDGSVLGEHTIGSASIFDSTAVLCVGGFNPSSVGTSTDGWLDRFRFTVGVPRYTAAFNPIAGARAPRCCPILLNH